MIDGSPPGTEVRVPPGKYLLSRPLLLRSRLRLILDGVTLVKGFDGSARGKPGGGLVTTSLGAMFNAGEAIPNGGTSTTAGFSVVEDIDILGGTLEIPPGSGGPGLCLVRARGVKVHGMSVRGCDGDWSVQLSGLDIEIRDVIVRAADSLFSDGIHVDSGSNIVVRDCDVISGDDAFAVGNDYDRPCSKVSIVDCMGLSVRASALKIYHGRGAHLAPGYRPINATQEIVVDQLRGEGGLRRNGALAIYGARQTDGGALVHTALMKNCYLRWAPLADHDGVNAAGIIVRSADRIRFEHCRLALRDGRVIDTYDAGVELDVSVLQ